MTHSTQTHDALDSARRSTSHAMERVGDRARSLGYGMRDLANRGVHTVSEGASAAQHRLGEYAHASGRYVAEHPMKSALIAAAVGAAVAGIVIAMRHRRQTRNWY